MDILFKSTLDEVEITNAKLEHTNISLKRFGRGSVNYYRVETFREEYDIGFYSSG